MIINAVTDTIGNTPLLKLDSKKWGLEYVDMYAKLEYMNPFGSVKDRTARGITKDIDLAALAARDGMLLESSSGNSAVALQMLASRHGGRLKSVSNRIRVKETNQLLQYLGVDIVTLPGASECPDPNQPANQLNAIFDMAASEPERYAHTSQYENSNNTDAHFETTARELYDDLPTIDMIVTGAGTGGTGGGIRKYIEANNKTSKLIGVMAHPNDFLPGIRTSAELHETSLYKKSDYDEIAEITSLSALHALRDLVQKEGVMAGPTTGANFKIALDWAKNNDVPNQNGTRKSIVFIACDRLQGYMSYIADRQPELFGINRKLDVITNTDEARDEAIQLEATELTLSKLGAVTIIDIRSISSYKAFHIKGSIAYPEDMLREVLLHETPFDTKVVVVCPIGEKSLHFARVLRGRGIEAYSIAGGLSAWRRAKQPLVRT